MDVSRRSVLKGIGGGAAALAGAGGLLTACGDGKSSSGSKRLVFADFGGATREARKVAFADPFTKETGVAVVFADADTSKFVLQAKQGRGDWDLCELEGSEAVSLGAQNYIPALPDSVPRSPAIPDEYGKFAAGGYALSGGIIYNAKTTSNVVPEDWADFWDVQKIPGKRAVIKLPYYIFEGALMADGVAPDKVYPLDFDRAVAKLDGLRPHLLFAETIAQMTQFVHDGTAAMGVGGNGRAYGLRKQGDTNIGFQWNQAVHTPWATYAVPKGAPNSTTAADFLSFSYDATRQAKFATESGYGPVNPEALKGLSPEVEAWMPNSPEHTAIACVQDAAVNAAQAEEYASRLTAWLSS